ncbi:alkaline phosphatase D family protein [Streptomyces sp. NPDC014622]|uniref:alkaline phosphatase D family protein n=1 Tax=Streptomyces sp. NPDC014622 TaxID=3364874 RepID=UPI0036F66A11
MHECVSLADCRARHGRARTDPDVQTLHAATPFIPTWDDHEVCGNTWSGGADDHDPATEGPWSDRGAAAQRAYFEWLPMRRINELASPRANRSAAWSRNSSRNPCRSAVGRCAPGRAATSPARTAGPGRSWTARPSRPRRRPTRTTRRWRN